MGEPPNRVSGIIKLGHLVRKPSNFFYRITSTFDNTRTFHNFSFLQCYNVANAP
jgi:hypothetical protein